MKNKSPYLSFDRVITKQEQKYYLRRKQPKTSDTKICHLPPFCRKTSKNQANDKLNELHNFHLLEEIWFLSLGNLSVSVNSDYEEKKSLCVSPLYYIREFNRDHRASGDCFTVRINNAYSITYWKLHNYKYDSVASSPWHCREETLVQMCTAEWQRSNINTWEDPTRMVEHTCREC